MKDKLNLNKRSTDAAIGLASLAVLYPIALKAIDTGSFWFYIALIVLLIFGINRLIKAVRGR